MICRNMLAWTQPTTTTTTTAAAVPYAKSNIGSCKFFSGMASIDGGISDDHVTAEGLKGLYAGLSAAMTRQFTYGTIRLGLYDVLRDWAAGPGGTPNVLQKMACGVCAGGIATALCCPVEVALVRMQADGAKPPDQRRGYRNVFDAWASVVREEGFFTLWRGVVPTVFRGMVVSMTQLATYDQAKEVVGRVGLPPGVLQHLTASLISGVVYCFASLPLDVVKSRVQSMKPDKSGRM